MTTERELLDRMAACARFAIPQIDDCAKHDEAMNLPNAAKACRQNSANFTKLLAEYDALPSSPDEKSAQAATAVNTAEGVDIRLFDGQWVNIVNAENCYREYSKEEAVHKAVKATEEKMRENIVKGWPKPRSSPPASAHILGAMLDQAEDDLKKAQAASASMSAGVTHWTERDLLEQVPILQSLRDRWINLIRSQNWGDQLDGDIDALADVIAAIKRLERTSTKPAQVGEKWREPNADDAQMVRAQYCSGAPSHSLNAQMLAALKSIGAVVPAQDGGV